MHRRDEKHKCFVVDSGPFREGLPVVLRWRAVGGQMDRILSRNRRFRNLRALTSALISGTAQGLEQGPNSRMLISLAVDSGRESSLTHLQVAARDHRSRRAQCQHCHSVGAEPLPTAFQSPLFSCATNPRSEKRDFVLCCTFYSESLPIRDVRYAVKCMGFSI